MVCHKISNESLDGSYTSFTLQEVNLSDTIPQINCNIQNNGVPLLLFAIKPL